MMTSVIAASSRARTRLACRAPGAVSGRARPDWQRYLAPPAELANIGSPHVPHTRMPDSRCAAGRPRLVRRSGAVSSALTVAQVSGSVIAGHSPVPTIWPLWTDRPALAGRSSTSRTAVGVNSAPCGPVRPRARHSRVTRVHRPAR